MDAEKAEQLQMAMLKAVGGELTTVSEEAAGSDVDEAGDKAAKKATVKGSRTARGRRVAEAA